MQIQSNDRSREQEVAHHRNGFVVLTQQELDAVFQILVDVKLVNADDREQFDRVLADKNGGRFAPCEYRLSGAKLWNYNERVYLADNIWTGQVPQELQDKIDQGNERLKELLGARGGKGIS